MFCVEKHVVDSFVDIVTLSKRRSSREHRISLCGSWDLSLISSEAEIQSSSHSFISRDLVTEQEV